MDYYLQAFRSWKDFSSRSSRAEYWMFTLIHLLVTVFLAIFFIATQSTAAHIVYWVYALVSIIPYFALAVRRLHDTGRSGWWMLVGFIPLIGPVVLLVFFVLRSEAAANEYGPLPQ